MTDQGNGKLFYILGASGAGKDSLMDYARRELAGSAPVVFAHRYITRPYQAGGENHVALSEAEFLNRQARGLFCMTWQAHGFYYGIGEEVRGWMSKGLNVVVNGSRGYLPQALEGLGDALVPVLIHVELSLLEQRLWRRGRENQTQIAERLAKAQAYGDLSAPNLRVVENNGSIEDGGAALVAVLRDVGMGVED